MGHASNASGAIQSLRILVRLIPSVFFTHQIVSDDKVLRHIFRQSLHPHSYILYLVFHNIRRLFSAAGDDQFVRKVRTDTFRLLIGIIELDDPLLASIPIAAMTANAYLFFI